MIGNDVVDLRDADSRTESLHPRFDERAFAAPERLQIARSRNPEQLRWMLWAAKEAAYKVARRMHPRTVFSPPQFVVTLPAAGDASVTHGQRRYSVEVRVEQDVVHAIAMPHPRTSSPVFKTLRLSADLEPTPERLSAVARELAIKNVAELLTVPEKDLGVTRRARIPSLQLRDRDLPGHLSLSHHGCVTGFAYLGAANPAFEAA